jgi:CheY-like chemotaxis protein
MAAWEANPGRVLVVEDDESTAMFVTRVLSRHGFDAAWVMDAEQASHRLQQEPFDVLLADCRLPGRSGIELARETRRSQPRIGIAVMTSYAEGGTEDRARASGADDFFEKPLHSSTLVPRVRALVTQSRTSRIEVSPSPSIQGAHEAPPMAPVPEARFRSVDSGPSNVAESGSDGRAVPRDIASALPDSTGAGDGGGHPQFEGPDGVGRTRSSALFDPLGVHDPRGEGSCDAIPRGEVAESADLLARALHPALAVHPAFELLSRRLLARRLIQPLIMWASGGPSVSIGSGAGRVIAVRTRPDWLVAD